MKQKKFYDQDFKLGAGKLVMQEGRSISSVSKDLGFNKVRVDLKNDFKFSAGSKR